MREGGGGGEGGSIDKRENEETGETQHRKRNLHRLNMFFCETTEVSEFKRK